MKIRQILDEYHFNKVAQKRKEEGKQTRNQKKCEEVKKNGSTKRNREQ